LQGFEVDPEAAGELRLVESEPFSQRDEVAGPEGARELLVGQGLRVGVGQRGGLDLLVGHIADALPVGLVFGFRALTRPVANKLFFHDGSPSGR
jgi:hypothetical protein